MKERQNVDSKRLLATCRDVDPEEIVKVKQRLSALEHESEK